MWVFAVATILILFSFSFSIPFSFSFYFRFHLHFIFHFYFHLMVDGRAFVQLESHSRRAAQPPIREARRRSDIAILVVQALVVGKLPGVLASVRLESHSRRAAQPPSRRHGGGPT